VGLGVVDRVVDKLFDHNLRPPLGAAADTDRETLKRGKFVEPGSVLCASTGTYLGTQGREASPLL